eukprot:scaffold25689_cov171-Cylindrotheca_fusiformis.AAC.1
MNSWKEDETKLPKQMFGMANSKLHHDCDPFLLFVRAAVVWSTIQNQMVLPPCPDPHDCVECFEAGLLDCLCDAPGPADIVPREIEVTTTTAPTAMDNDEDSEASSL